MVNFMTSFLVILLAILPSLLAFGVNRPVQFDPAPAQVSVDDFPKQPLRFQRLTIEDGLSQNSILTMLQDRQGYLWVGTQEGLNRYDGYEFTVFKHDPEDSTSLSHSGILSLFEDSSGMLWIGTWGGGLNRYDPRSGIFARFLHNPDNPDSLGNNLVAAIHEDREGRLWIGTMGGGLDLLDRTTGKFTHYTFDPEDPHSLSSNFVSVIYEDLQDRLWIGTGGFGTEGNGLNLFDPQTGGSTRFLHDPDEANSLSSNTISSVVEDSTGALWIGTGGYALVGAGLNRLDPENGQVIRYQNDPDDPASLVSNDIMKLSIGPDGVLWIGTWGGGVDRLDILNNSSQFLHDRHDPYNPESLSANIVWSILQDRSGVVWIGVVNGGLNKLNPQVQRFHLYRNNPGNPQSLGFDVVGPILEAPEDGIWIGTYGGGLEYLDRKTGIFMHYPAQSQQENTVMALALDPEGTMWVGSLNGLVAFDPESGNTTRYQVDFKNPDSLVDNNVSALEMDADGRLWVGTLSGLDYFDRSTGRFIHMGIPGLKSVISMMIDQTGQLWVGTWGDGLFRLDLATVQGSQVKTERYAKDAEVPTSLSDDSVWALFEDSFGTLWFGTNAGLNRFDAASGSFERYTEKDGLPNNNILCIQEDGQFRLWISTNDGLAQYNLMGNAFKNYDSEDGLQSNEFDSGSCAKMADGEMFFGGVRGMNSFYPDQILDNPIPPPVVFTDFRILNESVDVDLSGATPLQLESQQNFIDFEFAGLDFHDPLHNTYAYKLEGFDRNWIQSGTRRFISYTDLPGKKYVFRVKAANSDGVWNEIGASLLVEIQPPFWQAWWFWTGTFFIVLGVAAGGVSWRYANERRQRRRLEGQVERRTHELLEANLRLQDEMAQRQMVEEALANKAADEAVAAERNRLARDLHDAVTQTLFSISLMAEVIPELWEIQPAEAQKRLVELRQLGRGALAEMRTLLLELRPSALTDAALPDLLRQLTEAVIGRSRLPVELYVDGDCCISADVQIVVYRIAQEALNNVVKYSRATLVSVNLRMRPEAVFLSVVDNGIGFDPNQVPSNHLGLRIMRERAEAIGARLTIYSEPGEGTQVSVHWQNSDPVQPDEVNGIQRNE